MRVLVLGGDGFCGWPTSLYLSDNGHDVTILDNLSRRKIDIELEVESLTPIQPLGQRLRAWKEVSGREIAQRYRDRVDPSKIIARSVWRKGMETAEDLITDVPPES